MKCFFGHKWLITNKATVMTTWSRRFGNVPIPNTRYKKPLSTVIEKCKKCGKVRAWRGYDSWDYNERIVEKEWLDPDYARSEIEKINGERDAKNEKRTSRNE